MAKFTVNRPLYMRWRNHDISGPAGATHRIPDSLYQDFLAEFVTPKDGTAMPGLTWIEDDEIGAGGGQHPDLAAHITLGVASSGHNHDSAYVAASHTTAADPHSTYALDSDLTNHEGAADPHTGYQRESEKGSANGYASLDAGGTVPDAQIPATIARDSELVTTHAGLSGVTADQHHAQIHVLATSAGLGADHTMSGAAAGNVLRATSGTAAAFAQLGHGDLGSVTANQHHNQAHALTGADHTHSGGTAGRFMRETAATTFGFEAIAISRGGTVIQSGGLTAAINVIVWRAPFACTVTNVRGYRVGGTGATINARRNGTSNHLASALSLTSADTWMDGGAVQNTAYAAGDKLEIMVVTVAGSPTQVAIQVDFTRP